MLSAVRAVYSRDITESVLLGEPEYWLCKLSQLTIVKAVYRSLLLIDLLTFSAPVREACFPTTSFPCVLVCSLVVPTFYVSWFYSSFL
jgi:hypothetical protein